MFRNQYDSDVTIWSPQGRLHQVQRFSESTLVLKSNTFQFSDPAILYFTRIMLFHQVEYAMEAVKQGSATVGVKSNTHAVLVALKRASSELSR